MKKIIIILIAMMSFKTIAASLVAQQYEAIKVNHIYVTTDSAACGLQVLSIDPSSSTLTFQTVNNPLTGWACEQSVGIERLRCSNATCWQSEDKKNPGDIFETDPNGNFEADIGWCELKQNFEKPDCSYHYGSRYVFTQFTSNPIPTVFRAFETSYCPGVASEQRMKKFLMDTEESAKLKCSKYWKNCSVDKSRSDYWYSEGANTCFYEAFAIGH